jgi:glycosyltransferase involved in cell wall biosynthesis
MKYAEIVSWCANLKDYILITPVKNEEQMFHGVAECIIRQTQQPLRWVIIDGSSSDRSFQIAENLAKSYSWIFVKKQEQFSNSGGHSNFSLAVREAYQYLQEIALKSEIKYEFVGKLDMDQIIPQNFFEFLIDRCREDPGLGVVSGQSYSYKDPQTDNTKIIQRAIKPDRFPEGELPDKRLYRKEALDDIGGFPVTKYSPDSVILAKLRIKAWKIRLFPDIRIFNLRKDTGIERNTWSSSLQFGRSRYYLGYHPLLLLMSCAYTLIYFDIVKTIGLFFGYMISWVKNEELIQDKEVWRYFRYTRIKEIISSYL